MNKQRLDLTLFLDHEIIEWMDNKIALKEFQNRNEVVVHSLKLFMKTGEAHIFDIEA
jgi:hypothetical protein